METNNNLYDTDFFVKGTLSEIENLLKFWEFNEPNIKWIDDYSHIHKLTDYIKYFIKEEDYNYNDIFIIEYRHNNKTIVRYNYLLGNEETKQEYTCNNLMSILTNNKEYAKYPFANGQKYYAIEFDISSKEHAFCVKECVFNEKPSDLYHLSHKTSFKTKEQAEMVKSILNEVIIDEEKFTYPNGTPVMCSNDGLSWYLSKTSCYKDNTYYVYNPIINDIISEKYVIPYEKFTPYDYKHSIKYNINIF